MAQGVHFPAGQVSRIMQKLVYSTFTISNSFAGHLILTIPLLLLGWKRYFHKKNPTAVKVCSLMLIFYGCSNVFSSSNISLGLVAVLVGVVFFFKGDEIPEKAYSVLGLLAFITSIVVLGLTRSRAGMVCFGAGFLFASYLMAEKKAHKKMALSGMLVGIATAFYVAPQVGSFQVRLGYYRAMVDTFMKDVWGYGFGSFSHAYNIMKDAGIEESNIPHSFFFGYLGQGGIIAALSVIVCFVVTVYLIKTSRLDRFTKFCLIFGFSSWYFHAQLDFHIMIIGSLSCVGLVSLLCVTEEDKSESQMKWLFAALIPVVILTGYLNFQKVMSDRSYFYLYQILRDTQETPSLDKVKNIVAKLDAREPHSVSYLRESGNWAIGQYMMNKSINPIQKFEYLKFAEENLLRSNEKYPLETGIYVSLARVYKYQDNYKEARLMLDKAFEVYPYSPSAVSLEEEILREYRLRYPKESHFHEAFLKNKLKTIESHLGRLRFSEHLNLSSEQLNSIMSSLEKAVNEIFAEIAIISGIGIKVDTSEVSARVNEVLGEARFLVK
ncbi:MAG: O-antigen ligase family protein [Lentisphaerales bacterium]|nr:O-antigen ligase family protein [Lentisphaerales bacterium]